jgi:hypothetical protein
MTFRASNLLLLLMFACAAAPGAKPASPAPLDGTANREELEEVNRMIAGHESEPAETVFKNVKVLRGMTAGQFVKLMDVSFSRSLGVRCTHCHQDEWEYDKVPAKTTARDMWTMTRRINQELLPGVANLSSRNASVSCNTCHRGQARPAASVD